MNYNFPSQKKKITQKGPKWRKDHLDWASDVLFKTDKSVRASLHNKTRNLRSYLGFVDVTEYETLLNPNNMDKHFMPESIQHFPVAVPYLNVLIGEEFDRRFDFKGIITNPNSISKMEETKRDLFRNKINELISNPDISEEEAVEELKNFNKYINYEYQDIREQRVNLLLKHFIKELDLKLKFNEGFKNVCIFSEEAYIGEVINGRPVIEVLNPRGVIVLRSGSSNKYEDADIIAIYDYISPGQIQDLYYSDLKPSEVHDIDNDSNKITNGGDSDQERDEYTIKKFREMMNDTLNFAEEFGEKDDNYIETDPIDSSGNYRRVRLFWKSKKLIYQIKYYDQEDGSVKFRYESEHYIPNKDLGEEAKEMWVTQWWEGCKIGKDIYPYIRPRRIQFNKINDPGFNHPGIVGQIYNTGQGEAKSLLDRAFPYQKLYDAAMWRLTDAMSKYVGSVPEVDIALLPDGWNIDKWLFFLKKAGFTVKNSFNEGKKGAALGKIAGGMSGSSNTFNQTGLAEFIQQQINILNYVEAQLGRMIGIPPQRLGDVQNRETVGGVERAVTQSSFITNELFKIHDNVKKRVLMLLIELCKVAYKDNPMKFQYITDDYVNQIFEIDDDFCEEEYGILIDNDTDLNKLEQQFEMLTQAAIQNQMLKFSDVMKLYNSSSMSEKQRILERAEEESYQRAAEAQQAEAEQLQADRELQAQLAQQAQDLEEKRHQEKLALDKYKTDQQELTKRLGIQLNELEGSDPELEAKKLEMEHERYEEELLIKMKELNEKIRNNKAKEKLEEKKIAKMSVKSNK